MQLSHALELRPKWPCRSRGKDSHPILPTLASANGDLETVQIDVLDPERNGLAQTQAAAIHQQPDQPAATLELSQHGFDLFRRQHGGATDRLPGTHRID